MKAWKWICMGAVAALLLGCATEKQVADMQGRGDRRVYDAPFDQAWRAAIDAAQLGNLEITSADRAAGYISARRTIQPHTFGENVGVWVRPKGPAQSEVEVVSRQAGPPVAWFSNWQNEVHSAIAANLTREPSVGAPPGQTRVVIPEGPQR